ncbi:MAG: ATP-binding protein, partial [Planctomycetes bacterium]|nr:ATP-binding protein [Planctomycetota bacterium]
MSDRSLFLGREPGSPEADVRYPTANLTTHGVIVGMTGSGKTGLGVVLLEEVLRSGTPALVIDPKGDMGNLLLTFPELAPAEFEPWIDPLEAARTGSSPAELAAELSARWRAGLAEWGLGADDVRRLREQVEFGIYTPGSRAATPLNVLGSLAAPAGAGPEARLEEVQGLVGGLLGLIGVDADPLTSREHILLTNVIERAWSKGEDLDLARLIQQVQSPPLRKLGVFELETFYPAKDRLALAMRLNGLVANPAFAAWLEGEPLDPQRLLWTADGRPRASVIYLAHLSAEERQFVVALLLARVASWMQTLPGSSDLRALIYMDEVYGFCPPTAMPPAKRPLLTLLKQARAFGVGVVLATQNPIDLDYKAMSNAGTWFVGRLQTERDQARVADALAGEGAAPAELRAQLAGLGKRTFLLRDPKAQRPRSFATRWALSYLAGPLTRAQLGRFAPAPVAA